MGDLQAAATASSSAETPVSGPSPGQSGSLPGSGTLGKQAVQHSNLYVRNLPSDFSEEALSELFATFGVVESCRIAKQPHTQASKGFGFVKLATVEGAMQAIDELHGKVVGEASLEVRSAEADVTQRSSGQVPGDNLYVRNIPPDWTQQAVVQMFAKYGTVADCRLLASNVASGRSALVRLSTPQEASAAIQGEAGKQLANGDGRLQVRYADTAEEKRAKRANKTASSPRPFTMAPPNTGSDLPAGFTSFGPQNEGHMMAAPEASRGPGPGPRYPGLPTGQPLGMDAEALRHALPQNATASVYVKNLEALPPETSKLFLYEQFAPHGAILSVRVLLDPSSGLYRGVGFVNYTSPLSALAAVQALHGFRASDRDAKPLHVSLQTLGQARPGRRN